MELLFELNDQDYIEI